MYPAWPTPISCNGHIRRRLLPLTQVKPIYDLLFSIIVKVVKAGGAVGHVRSVTVEVWHGNGNDLYKQFMRLALRLRS